MELNKICVFNPFIYDRGTIEYLQQMYGEVRYANSCPKTGQPIGLMYPGIGNFKFFNDHSKMESYRISCPKRTSYWASHLLEGRKFFLVWSHD